MEAIAEVKELITTWAATLPDEIISEHRNGFYSADIVIDAYKAGYAKGTTSQSSSVKEQIRAAFYKKANLFSEALVEATAELNNGGYTINKLFINHNLDESKAIIAIDAGVSLERTFIEYFYSKAHDIEEKYFSQKLSISISYIEDSTDINLDLLHSDGYGFGYDLITKEPIVLG
jgi:hypothetical protein